MLVSKCKLVIEKKRERDRWHFNVDLADIPQLMSGDFIKAVNFSTMSTSLKTSDS